MHSIYLELAKTHGAVLELKPAGRSPSRKLQNSGGKAAYHYRTFLRSFPAVGDPQGKSEGGVEAHVLLACCNLSQAPKKVAALDPGLEKALLQEAQCMLMYAAR